MDLSGEDGVAEGLEEGQVAGGIGAMEHVADLGLLALADPSPDGGFVFEMFDHEVEASFGGGKEALGKDADEVVREKLEGGVALVG